MTRKWSLVRTFRSALFLAMLGVAAAIATSVLGAQPAARPILILISIDGFRWDYFDKAHVPTLKALAARGVRSEGLIPSFPSVTFPNHYTIVTGLRPDHHGVIANGMFDPAIGPDKFTMSSKTALDPRWWGGEPIWITAMTQGQRAAAMFWPGSEAVLPDFWSKFDDNKPNPEKVEQVLTWMRLPEAERPTFNTLYYSDVDHAGHDYGPDAPETLKVVEQVDASIGQLVAGVEQLGLTGRTTFMVVSDHGMAATSPDRVIFLDDYLPAEDLDVIEWSPILEVRPRPGHTVDELYGKLAGKHPSLAIYKRDEMPAHFTYGTHARTPPIIGVAEMGWTITTRQSFERRKAAGTKFQPGAHGFDPRYRELHGLFIAAGPKLREGVVVPEFENIHLYNLMCDLLGLWPAKNDGDFSQVRTFLK
jgi:predicted AlkP superfamily pyrophosphatase or phosphodiesterase